MTENSFSRRWRVRVLGCAVALALLAGPGQAAEPLSGKALVTALRKGGFNIFFRHAATERSGSDNVAAEGEWTSCDPKRMRQLSEEGRRTARALGAALRALRVPVGRVLASEFCRAAETARLMAVGPVETTREIIHMAFGVYLGGREALLRRGRRQLAVAPVPGTNTVLVGHLDLMRETTGIEPLEGGAGVFAPDGAGDFKLVAHFTAKELVALAERYGDGN
ncbi:MAG: histidine phosphatase family protein [SAR324 cluster bacterium]|nr:histidine phosphatase family protein [SAR324 cluster bacterium]